MKCTEAFDKIDELNCKYISFWEDICNIESPTADKAGVDAVGNYVAEAAKKLGWKVERYPQPSAGDIITVTMNADSKEAPLTLSAHMDTVHPKGLFGYPPVRFDKEKIYGPGVTDCKGGIAAAFLCMDALSKCGFDSRPIRLLLQSDEEGGSAQSGKATINYMCEASRDSVAFLNLEGYNEGKICIQRKGIITFKFAVTGKEAHSSLCATDGANAIAAAACMILKMEQLKDRGGLTCNVGVIRGGSVPNTVAGYCEFYANVRYATAEQAEWVRAYAKEVAEGDYVRGCTCTLTQTGSRLAMERVERNLALVDLMNRAFEENGLPALTPCFNNGGSDAAEITNAGIPCVDSIGTRGGSIHSADEYSWLDSLSESAKRMAAVAYNI